MSTKLTPDYIFEASWEVCNLVGGIYTVLSTRAATLTAQYADKLIFIGPDIWKDKTCQWFLETSDLSEDWRDFTFSEYGLKIRTGRWNIPGNPVAVLVDFYPLLNKKNEIYFQVWEHFGVNSIAAYGDYDESSMFGYAAGMVVDSYCRFFKITDNQEVVSHFNEWMTSFGTFYIREHQPHIASLFTTHATSIGRSIAGNHKPLYDYLKEYNGDQMATELNMVSKHSAEKAAAHVADCFTTVSEITALECEQLLDKKPDVITPNGFEDGFVPKGEFNLRRMDARSKLKQIAEALLGYSLKDNVFFVSTAGRYEYKNKGIDTFIESLKYLSDSSPDREIVAFIMVPAHIRGPRADLVAALQNGTAIDSWNRFTTHELFDYYNDPVMSAIHWFHFTNLATDKVKIIFVPSYLGKSDGIFNVSYYNLLIGMDITVFPSYYEPWGYTPLESVAFSVPTITTDLSGFGQWVSHRPQDVEQGVGVVHRSDYNGYMVASQIATQLARYAGMDEQQRSLIREKAKQIAEKARWEHFIRYYYQAYDIALKNKSHRIQPIS